MTDPNDLSVNYKYDALGRRSKRVEATNQTKFTYDGDEVLMDDDSVSGITRYQNGPGIDDKLKLTNSTTSKYFVQDHLGSTTALTDQAGNIISSAAYDSFGNSSNTLGTRYQYTGREKDDTTGLYYYRARWYDSQLGRFISEDPIGLNGGINQFGYVSDNPVSRTDAEGLYLNDYLARINEVKFQIEQKTIEGLETPILAIVGFGDSASFGITRYIRQAEGLQGLDAMNLDCSVAYQAGGYASTAVEVLMGGYGIYKAIGKTALKQSIKSGIKVASSGGKIEIGSTVRQLARGEKASDLIEEVARLTYETGGAEHAIISLKDGTRLIVRGGEGGIDFLKYNLRRVILHTHPSPTGPSAIDFRMLADTGQKGSYIYELFGGGLTKFWR